MNNQIQLVANRTMKLTTLLKRALREVGMEESAAKAIFAALKKAAKDDVLTEGATVYYYPDGWHSNSTRKKARGRQIIVELHPFGITIAEREIEARRSYGRGPKATVFARRKKHFGSLGARILTI